MSGSPLETPALDGTLVVAYTYWEDTDDVAYTYIMQYPTAGDYTSDQSQKARIYRTQAGCKVTYQQVRAGTYNCDGAWLETDEERTPVRARLIELKTRLAMAYSYAGYFEHIQELYVDCRTDNAETHWGGWTPYEWIADYEGTAGKYVLPFKSFQSASDIDEMISLEAMAQLFREAGQYAIDYAAWEREYGSDAQDEISELIDAGGSAAATRFPQCECTPIAKTEETANLEGIDSSFTVLINTAGALRTALSRNNIATRAFKDYKPSGTFKTSDPIQTAEAYSFSSGYSTALMMSDTSAHSIPELGLTSVTLEYGTYSERTIAGEYSWAPIYHVQQGDIEGASTNFTDLVTDAEAETFATTRPWPNSFEINQEAGEKGMLDWVTGNGALQDRLIVNEGDAAAKNLFIDSMGDEASNDRSAFADILFFYYHVAKKYKDYMVLYKDSASGQPEAQAEVIINALESYLTAIENLATFVEKQMCFICFTWAGEYYLSQKDEEYADLINEFPGKLVLNPIATRTDFRARAEARRAAADARSAAEGRDIQVPPFFREQCFLLAQMPYFAEWKRQVIEREEPKNLPYIWYPDRDADAERERSRSANSNACLMADGEPFGFMNKLTQYPSYSSISNMKTSEIANLQPMIKIYKILIDDDGEESQMEIPFESHFTEDDFDLFRNINNRGQGIGIKDFTFSFEADNPFALKKSIKARLTLFANSFSELLRGRQLIVDDPEARRGRRLEEFKYVDLALKTGTGKSFSVGTLDPNRADVVVANLDKLNFRIKAVVGWNYRSEWGSVSQGSFQLGEDNTNHTLSDGVRAALYDSYITLNLTPVIHEFDIDDQGRVDFKIDYLAYVEDFFDQPAFNIFPNVQVDESLLPGERHDMELYTESARVMRDIKSRAFAAECNSDQMRALKEELATEVEIYRMESMKAIMDEMMARKKIRYVNLTANDVYAFRRAGPNWAGIEAVFNGENLGDVLTGVDGGIEVYEEGSSPVSIREETIDQIETLGLEEADKNRRLRALAATGADTNIQPVSFFYISDLVDVILKTMDQKYSRTFELSILHNLESLRGEVSAQYNFGEGTKMREILEAKIIRFNQMDAQFKKLRILLGPMELVHQGNFISEFYSIGDIPVAVKYFIEWLSKKMSDRDEVYYSLPKFLNDLVNDMCRDILNDSRCFRNQAKQRIRMNQAACTSYKIDASEKFPRMERRFREDIGSQVSGDDITGDYIDELTADILMFRMDESRPYHSRMNIGYYGKSDRYFPLPVLNIAGNRGNPVAEDGVDKEVNWLVYYAGRTQPVEKMQGVEELDAQYGIFHYTIGKDRGITKTIKLKKTDTTGLKELRFEQEGYDGLQQLREVFDVTIDTYANVQAFPGLYIYVDPAGFSPNSTIGSDIVDLTQIGIGGYHMIVRSEHSFGPGYANSKIEAKWVASTHALVTQDIAGSDTSESQSEIGNERYCFAAEQRQQRRQRAAEQEREEETQAMIDSATSTGPSWWNPFAYIGLTPSV